MATTTNYSWTTPDDTALVKDGAAAIRTLGSSVDTTVKALNPGTTAGDIDYYTSSTAKSRIAIGTSGQVLTVNGSGVPAWTTASAGGMTLLSTTTLSGATTTISSIDQTYKNLAVFFYGVRGTAGTFNIAVNGLTTSTNTISVENNGGSFVNAFPVDSVIKSANNWAGAGANNANWLLLPNYTQTGTSAYKPFNCFGYYTGSTGNEVTWNASGGIKTTSAITSLVFGGLTSFTAGTVLVYGVK